jgi:arylsulfatase A-like enzyme
MGPNILLLILDAARRDGLEPYGAPAGSTPALAQLAARGNARSNVYATAPWTVPSHASIFTGLMPRAAGLSKVASPQDARNVLEAQRSRLLPEVLRRNGYATAGVSANFWLSELSGFATGFDEFKLAASERKAQIDGQGLRRHLHWLAEAARGRVDDGAREAERVLERWIAAAPRTPFFWFVNLVECHSPYLPPRPYGNASTLDRVRAGQDARRYFTLYTIWQACGGAREVPEATLERARRLYTGSIRYLDDWVARLLDRLDASGILDETLVIVTADHGENIGEGGLVAHGLSLDDRLIHVPFIAAGPGGEQVVLTSLAELPRRLADATGIVEHPWQEELPAGVGIAQCDPPADADDERALQTLAEMGLDEEGRRRFTAPMSCAVQADLKLVDRNGQEEVYDLASDPDELAPLDPGQFGSDRANELARLRAALSHPAMVSRAPEQLGSSERTAELPEDELRDLEARMKLLGYM